MLTAVPIRLGAPSSQVRERRIELVKGISFFGKGTLPSGNGIFGGTVPKYCLESPVKEVEGQRSFLFRIVTIFPLEEHVREGVLFSSGSNISTTVGFNTQLKFVFQMGTTTTLTIEKEDLLPFWGEPLDLVVVGFPTETARVCTAFPYDLNVYFNGMLMGGVNHNNGSGKWTDGQVRGRRIKDEVITIGYKETGAGITGFWPRNLLGSKDTYFFTQSNQVLQTMTPPDTPSMVNDKYVPTEVELNVEPPAPHPLPIEDQNIVAERKYFDKEIEAQQELGVTGGEESFFSSLYNFFFDT